MISESCFDHLYSFSEGRVLLTNLANQLSGDVVDNYFAKSVSAIFENCKNSDELSKALFYDADSLKFNTQHLLNGTRKTRLIRVSLWPTILDSVVPETDSVDAVSRIKDHLAKIQERHSLSSVGDHEEAHREFFENRYGSVDFLNKSWMEAQITKPISLKEPMLDVKNPVFCTIGDGKYGEAQIFTCNGEECADAARDLLGLIHFDNTWYDYDFIPLGAIAFDFDFHESQNFGRPTIVEAGTHSRFRGTYGELGGKVGKWGRAFDLSKINESVSFEGGREVTVLDFKPAKTWVTFLGFVRVPRGDVMGKHDHDFLKICLNGQSVLEIKQLLGVV